MTKLLLFCVFMVILSANNVRSTKEITTIEIIIAGLNKEVWDKREVPCREKTLELLHSVNNFTLWATWVWDANKFPSGSLYSSWFQISNFDQCMKPPWLNTHPQLNTQYCLAEVKMAHTVLKRSTLDPYGSTEVFLKMKTRSGLNVNRFLWGICVPAICQPRSVVKIVKHMYLLTHFRTISRPNITVDHCQIAGTTQENPVGYYLFIGLLTTLFVISLGSTYYRTQRNSHTAKSNSFVAKILESFCMVKNSEQLTKIFKNEIKILNGIRFLTSFNIVTIHVFTFTIQSGTVNARDYENDLDTRDKTLNLNVIVDTFFVLSGLLYIRSLLDEYQPNLLITLLKRYIRLIGLFILSIFYIIYVIKINIGLGPLWYKIAKEECDACQKNWLKSILMINNSTQTLCYAITWYIACDYQMTVFATVLFHIYQKWRKAAFAVFGLAAVMSVIIPGFLTYWFELTPIFFLDFSPLNDLRNYEPMNYTYMKSYSRASPYLAGLCLGYLMHVYKPDNYRRSLSTLCSTLGILLSVVCMMSSMGLGHFFLDREYDAIEAGIAAALYRTVWGAAICCMIAFCEYGHVPPVKKFLSLSFFTPLSRLSYGLFMVHNFVLLQAKKFFTVKSPPILDMFSMMFDTVGAVTISLAISYVLWLIVEAPLNNLSNHFICNRFKSREVDENNKEKEEKKHEHEFVKTKTT